MAGTVRTNEGFHPRAFLKLEPSGVRTSLATVLPLIVGQIVGYPVIGLYVGLSGLYLSVSDKEGSTLWTLFIGLILNAAIIFAGTILGNYTLISIAVLFFLAFAGGMLAAFGEVATQIGFVITLIFAVALGQPGNYQTASERFLEFVAGGTFSLMLTSTLWYFNRRTSSAIDETDAQKEIEARTRSNPIRGLLDQLTPRSIIFRHAMRLAVASMIAVAIFKYFHLERGHWMIITVLVIVKPIFADTRRRAIERVMGSVAGGVLAVLIGATFHSIIAIDIFLLFFSVLAFSHVRTNYGFYALFLTPFIILMIETVSPSDWEIAFVRVFDTLIGGGIALSVSYLLRPRSAFSGKVESA